jgi:hypothetical protein
MRYPAVVLVLLIVLNSCSSSRKIVNTDLPDIRHTDSDVAAYIKRFGPIAISEMQRTGVPASITLAQGIIESDYGRSRLARQANNHFGIKCHSDWRGKKIYHDDDRRGECFRSYPHAEESYRDHSDFLLNGSRYRSLFKLSPEDYKGWARGLKKAGYATNPKYANMLIDMIEKNDLYLYDRYAIGKKVDQAYITDKKEDEIPENLADTSQQSDQQLLQANPGRVKVINRIECIVTREGDTFKSLAEEFDLLRWELLKYNDLSESTQLQPGMLLYLQPKRLKAEVGNEYHVVVEGETMYSISQKYGIKLKTLYERNHIAPGMEPKPGEELWLRKTRPEGIR